jgi:hypothetical protein
MQWAGGRERRPTHDDDRLLRELVQHVHAIDQSFKKLVDILSAPQGKAELGLFVREIHGRRSTMITRPPIVMLDVERVLVSTAPRKPDGTPDPAVQVSWVSSAPDQVGIEVLPEHEGLDAEGLPITIPGTHEAWLLTPLDRGAADVTISAPGYESTLQPLSYEPGVRGQLNVSVGTPVPD